MRSVKRLVRCAGLAPLNRHVNDLNRISGIGESPGSPAARNRASLFRLRRLSAQTVLLLDKWHRMSVLRDTRRTKAGGMVRGVVALIWRIGAVKIR